MKNAEYSRTYLECSVISRHNGKPLAPKALSDIVSSCLRADKALELDLDVELSGSSEAVELVALKVRTNSSRLGYEGLGRYFYNDFVAFVRQYYRHLNGKFIGVGPYRWPLSSKKKSTRQKQ